MPEKKISLDLIQSLIKKNPSEKKLMFSELLKNNVPELISFSYSDLEKISLSLSLTNESDRGTLTLRPKPGKSMDDKEVEEFLKKVKSLFKLFKEALQKMNVDVDSFILVANKDGLIIRIPSPKYYDLFIDQLTSFLLNDPPVSLTLKDDLTPLGMRPEFRTKDKTKEQLAAERRFNPTPLPTELING